MHHKTLDASPLSETLKTSELSDSNGILPWWLRYGLYCTYTNFNINVLSLIISNAPILSKNFYKRPNLSITRSDGISAKAPVTSIMHTQPSAIVGIAIMLLCMKNCTLVAIVHLPLTDLLLSLHNVFSVIIFTNHCHTHVFFCFTGLSE